MTLNLLDIAPIYPYEREQWNDARMKRNEARMKAEQERQQKELKQLQEEQKKQATDKKTLKAKRKAEKKAAKAKKKAKKAQKKAENQAQKSTKDISAAPVATTATVQIPTGTTSETEYTAAMPTGVVLAVCASLVISIGSAWFYRRSHTGTDTL